CRCHIFTTGSDQDFFLPAGDGQKSIVIQMANISGTEPTIYELFSSLFWQVEVTLEHTNAISQNFTVFGYSDATPWGWLTHGTDSSLAWAIDRHGRGCFCQSVAFFDVDPYAPEKVTQIGT